MLTAVELSAAAEMTPEAAKGFALVVGLFLLWLWARD